MARRGCSVLLLVVAALAAASSAPASRSVPPHLPASDLPLAELAARRGFTLPPRPLLQGAKTPVSDRVTGAQAYPFGLADPQPPQRSGHRKLDGGARAKRAADDIYDEVLLPTNVVPTRYTVTMAPNLVTKTFHGKTDIYLNVVENTSRIVLHGARDISFDGVEISKYSSGEWADNGKATLLNGGGDDLERIVVDLEKELVPGEHYLLRFPLFSAYLRTDLKGFYLSSYENESGEKVWLATTQFEPPAARFAFPCFDEPALKARFKIIVEHDHGLFARSNMPAVSITNMTTETLDIVRTEFDDTLPMSTYLLAWVVSDFGGLTTIENTPFNITTWGRKNALNENTAYLANMVAPKALDLLKEFTGISYALPKVDQFAIPDFDAGAMENWGLVTYREEYSLETNETTIRIREFIATTVCHELGHQWTGNLVTLDWWSNTWLNEGFATYFESVICDKIFPDWQLMDLYVTDNVHVGIANDVMPNQIAMSSPVFTTGGVKTKFDRISYKKGGSVLRMFEHVLGTEVFKKAMNRYLSVNSFKNGSPDRLFHAMDAEANLTDSNPLPGSTDFATMAKSWTEQAGVPVVTVTRDTSQSFVNITQEQFFYEIPEDQEVRRWYVPIPAIVNPHTKDWTTTPEYWLTPNAPSIVDLDVDASESEWILVNPNQIGYYMVNYDVGNWRLLLAALQTSPAVLPASTRTQLVHDALAMARAGRLDYETALPFLQALKAERSPAAWKAGVEALAFLRDRLAATPAAAALKAFVQDITADAYDAVGLGATTTPSPEDTSKDQERYLRFFVTSYACYGGNEKCINDSIDAVSAMFENNNSINADVKDAALCYAMQNSSTLFNSTLDKYKVTLDTKARAQLAAAIGCTGDHAMLQKLLDDIIAGDSLNAADLQQLVNAMLSRWENHRFMLDYYKANWDRIRAYTANLFYVNMLTALIGDIRTQDELQEVTDFVGKAFPDTKSEVRAEAELRLAAAEKGLAWSRRHFEEVSQWLYDTTNVGPVEPPTTEAPTTAPPGPTTKTPTTQAPTEKPTTQAPTGIPSTASPEVTTKKNAALRVTGAAYVLTASLLALVLRAMN